MHPMQDPSQESILDTREDLSPKCCTLDESHGTSTSYPSYDSSSRSDSYPFDDVFSQGLMGYEPYFSGLGYESISTATPSPSTYSASATSMPPGTHQENTVRTRSGPRHTQPMGTISSPSTNLFDEYFTFPNQVSADVGFRLSKEPGSSGGTQIQSVRNSQLEKRRAQNRNSQRAFRERKESYTNSLERELMCLQEKYDAVLRCLHRLRAAYAAIESLDRFDLAINERGMRIAADELKMDIESETDRGG